MDDPAIIGRNEARITLLNQETLNNWNKYGFLLDYINDSFKKYLSLLPTFEGLAKTRIFAKKNDAYCLCSNITNTVASYLKGNLPAAYKSMHIAFECAKPILIRKASSRLSTGMEFGFKARIFEKEKSMLHREDIFHIPFEKRHLVQDHRYSIHGIPSVYLGRSIYDCYIELGRPNLNDLWVSLFIFQQDKEDPLNPNHITLIDLTPSHESKRIGLVWDYVKKDESAFIRDIESLVDDILLWPLVVTCSIACKFKDAVFRQEYIVPQMLYQLCSNLSEYIGIKYVSTHQPYVNPKINPHAMINYALPAQDVRKAGFCPKLSSQLILSEPITIQECAHVDINTKNRITTHGFPLLSNMDESLADDNTIVELDKMTLYFNSLVENLRTHENTHNLQPLYGWADE